MDDLRLTKVIPARCKTITLEWVKRDFMEMSPRYREIRSRTRNPMDSCFWCGHGFEDGEMMALGCIGKGGNKVFCHDCLSGRNPMTQPSERSAVQRVRQIMLDCERHDEADFAALDEVERELRNRGTRIGEKEMGERCDRLEAERDAALAQLEEARKDGERLDWLDGDASFEPQMRTEAITDLLFEAHEPDIRQAIDAARAEGEE